mmetsp:Transcript_6594/g.20543  ORF Transcript_6594/g.20543 Transcript_6594/m.20543 type:complete len:482 (-) Transcript_6594:2269-3714(-)
MDDARGAGNRSLDIGHCDGSATRALVAVGLPRPASKRHRRKDGSRGLVLGEDEDAGHRLHVLGAEGRADAKVVAQLVRVGPVARVEGERVPKTVLGALVVHVCADGRLAAQRAPYALDAQRVRGRRLQEAAVRAEHLRRLEARDALEAAREPHQRLVCSRHVDERDHQVERVQRRHHRNLETAPVEPEPRAGRPVVVERAQVWPPDLGRPRRERRLRPVHVMQQRRDVGFRLVDEPREREQQAAVAAVRALHVQRRRRRLPLQRRANGGERVDGSPLRLGVGRRPVAVRLLLRLHEQRAQQRLEPALEHRLALHPDQRREGVRAEHHRQRLAAALVHRLAQRHALAAAVGQLRKHLALVVRLHLPLERHLFTRRRRHSKCRDDADKLVVSPAPHDREPEPHRGGARVGGRGRVPRAPPLLALPLREQLHPQRLLVPEAHVVHDLAAADRVDGDALRADGLVRRRERGVRPVRESRVVVAAV